jgi:hypothetical protein
VRYRYTPYWATSDACVSRTTDGWTRVAPDEPGVVIVRARFGGRRASGCD